MKLLVEIIVFIYFGLGLLVVADKLSWTEFFILILILFGIFILIIVFFGIAGAIRDGIADAYKQLHWPDADQTYLDNLFKYTIRSYYKYLLSFSKNDWELEDYPIRYKEQDIEDPSEPLWTAQIIKWWNITGVGESKNEAFENLRSNLNAVKKFRSDLPRPGTISWYQKNNNK